MDTPIACLILAAAFAGGCSEDDDACVPGWRDILEDRDEDSNDLNASILSVWGPSRDNLAFAGGTLGVAPRRARGRSARHPVLPGHRHRC